MISLITRLNLIDDLKAKLEAEFQGYMLPNKNAVMQKVNIYSQYMPRPHEKTYANGKLPTYSDSEYEENYPCVVIRLADMLDGEENSRNMSTVNVKFLTAICNEDDECTGYRDIINIQEKIRAILLENRVICNRYVLLMPMKTSLFDVDAWPVYYGEIDCTYTIARPVQNYQYVHGFKKAGG